MRSIFRLAIVALIACGSPSSTPDASVGFSHGALGGIPGGGFVPPTKVSEGSTISGLIVGDVAVAASSTSLTNGSMTDDGTYVTIDGMKLKTCSQTISSGASLVNLTIPDGCGVLLLTDNVSSFDVPLVGIAPPASGVRSVWIINVGPDNIELYAKNTNATAVNWQLEGDFVTWYQTAGVAYQYVYDTTNSFWTVVGISADVGEFNVNGPLTVSANVFGTGEFEWSASSYSLVLNYALAGDDYIRAFNASTGTIHIGDGTANGTASVVIGDPTTAIHIDSASGPTISSGSGAPSGSCVSGSVYLQTSGSVGFNACISSAWNAFANASGGHQFLGEQVFTASGTYTPTSGAHAIIVTMIGGGGGGGGAQFGSTNAACGGGGGGGTIVTFTLIPGGAIATSTITIGTGGTAGASSGGQGGTGGDTTFLTPIVGGTTYTAKGGVGGLGTTATAATGAAEGGFVPTTGSTGPTGARFGGERGGHCIWTNGTSAGIAAGAGADSPYGTGGFGPVGSTGTGQPALGQGAGGGGGASTSGVGHTGGAGAGGIVVIDEFN